MQQDPERPWWYLPADEVLRGLRIFDSSGKEITKNLTLEKRDDHVVRVSGVAPGFPSTALPLRLVWKRGERIFEFQPRLGNLYKERVIAPPLGGEWKIFLMFSANSAEQVNDPARFTPPRFTLTLPPNAHPKADFIICDNEIHYFQKIGFCGTPSSDPDGVIVKYQWSWPGSAILEAKAITYRFSQPQILPITLTVTDNRLRETKVTKEVAVDQERTIGGKRVTIPPAFVRQNSTTYEVEVLTGDGNAAGTDARVFLGLYEPKEQEGVVYGSGVLPLSQGEILLSEENGMPFLSPGEPLRISTTSFSSTITRGINRDGLWSDSR